MRCPWCGVDNAVNVEICANCGTFLISRKEAAPAHQGQAPPPLQPYVPPPSTVPTTRPPLKKKRSRWPEIVVAIAAVVIILVLVMLPMTAPLGGTSDVGPTYRDLEGAWKTALPVPFNVRTNSGPTGTMENSGTELREMTFEIELTSDPALVLVTMSYSVFSSDIWNGSQYIAEQSPDIFAGEVNGTHMTISQGSVLGVFTFTRTEMSGYWDYYLDNGNYTQEIVNTYFDLALKKQ